MSSLNASGRRGTQRLAVLAILGLAVVVLSALAVAILEATAAGALLGVLVLLAALGVYQQRHYARRSAAQLAALARALDATDRRVAEVAKDVAAQSESAIPAVSKEVSRLSKTVAQWSRDVKEAEIETGIAALNRYVALGSDDATHA